MSEFAFIFIILILLMSVIIHEVSHGYAALYLGDPTAKYAGRLTLNPLKHLDFWGSFLVPLILFVLPGNLILGWAKPVPFNPYNFSNQRWGEAIVALVGPFSNFIIALFFGLFLRVFADSLPQSVADISSLIIFINMVLGLFNLIPVPPLDGSKVLFSLLPQSASVAKTRAFLEVYGFWILIFSLLLFGSFIFSFLNGALLIIFYILTGNLDFLMNALKVFS